MIVLLLFAFLSGVVTILSPCILPVLPIVLSGSLGRGRARPFGVIAGFVASFTLFTLALSAIVQALGIPADALRLVAVALIVAFGLVLLVPALNRIFEVGAARLASLGQEKTPATGAGKNRAGGFWGGLVVGFSLGLVWTPCVGPIMASVISLSLTSRVDGGAILITLSYTIGTSIPMLAVMLGGRALITRVPALTRNAPAIQRGFGLLMIALGFAIGFGFDRRIQAAILTAFPSYGSGLTVLEQVTPVETALRARGGRPVSAVGAAAGRFSGAPEGVSDDGKLGDYGMAPEFVAEGPWYNSGIASPPANSGPPQTSAALSLADLRGKVVMVDFWTYSCVNCVRTLPYLRAWYETYKDKGFVIVGVHSPEFEFEKVGANLAKAMGDLGVGWPVVQDNNYAEWNAYANRYWPAHYFIDAKGRVRYFHFGEGGYEASEAVIKALLKEAGAEVGSSVTMPAPVLEASTPETYLGYERGKSLASSVAPVADKAIDYIPSKTPGNGEWSLEGRWTIASQYIVPESGGTLRLGFNAKKVFLVIEPEGGGGSLSASVDGRAAPDTPDLKGGRLEPKESRLYQLIELPAAGEHILTIVARGRLRLFAFTFG